MTHLPPVQHSLTPQDLRLINALCATLYAVLFVRVVAGLIQRLAGWNVSTQRVTFVVFPGMIRSIGTKGAVILATYACVHVALNVRVARVPVLKEMVGPYPILSTLLIPMHPFPTMDKRGGKNFSPKNEAKCFT